MIFVPNKYVFIVGGNDKIVYYFDCETKKIAKWAELNENHIEPSLILYKNKDLYVFSNGDDEIVFEKSDLSSGKPKFEKIEPRLEADLNEFGQKFFGVCLKDENTFIFLGGEMNNENEFNYEYDIDENLIKKSDLKFKRFNLREKTFMKYNKKIDFLLTDFNRGRPEILVYKYKNNKNYFNSIFYSADNLKRSSLNNETQKKNKKYNFDMPDFSNYENNKFNFDFNNNVNNNLKEENENNFQSAEKNFNNNNNIKSIFNYDGEIPNASTKFTNEAIRSNQKDGMGFDSNNSNNIPDNHNKKNSNQEIINEGPEIDSNVRNFDDDNNNNSNRNLNNINNDNNNNDDDNNNDDNNNVMIVNNEDDNDNNDDNNNRMIENEDDNNNNNNSNNDDNNFDGNLAENEDDNNNNNNSNNDDNNNKMIENEDDNNNNNNSNNDDNNFDGNLARSSIIINNSKGNEKKSELPLANKTRNKIRSTFLGNSGILDRNDIEENLGKSFNAGIGGKKI